MRLGWVVVLAVLAVAGCGDEGRLGPLPCAPECTGVACGDDGCGGSCGECSGGAVCGADRQCTCTPRASTGCCGAAVCWLDSCGGAGEALATCEQGCGPDHRCIGCPSDCTGRECGLDGCGGFCGTCAVGVACDDGRCACEPHAKRACCGPNACWFDSCGKQEAVAEVCPGGCNLGLCGTCEPTCDGRECGVDGCGKSCGKCTGGKACSKDGTCECTQGAQTQCCGTSVCSFDSCGNPEPEVPCPEGCFDGECRCDPDCSNRECGPDGCEGSCGQCGGDLVCENGRCVIEACDQVPACVGACQTNTSCGLAGAAKGGVWDFDNFECSGGRCLYAGCKTDEECEDETTYPSNDLVCRKVACGFRICTASCGSPKDCVGTVSAKGPLTGEENFVCDGGWCRYAGCQSDDECAKAMASLPSPKGYRCRQVAGVGACVRACSNVNDCVIQPATPLADADNYACEGGACRYKGCGSTAECQAAYAGTPGVWECAPGFLAPPQ